MINPDAEFAIREDANPVATQEERSASGPLDAARGIFNGFVMGALIWVLIFWVTA